MPFILGIAYQLVTVASLTFEAMKSGQTAPDPMAVIQRIGPRHSFAVRTSGYALR